MRGVGRGKTERERERERNLKEDESWRGAGDRETRREQKFTIEIKERGRGCDGEIDREKGERVGGGQRWGNKWYLYSPKIFSVSTVTNGVPSRGKANSLSFSPEHSR